MTTTRLALAMALTLSLATAHGLDASASPAAARPAKRGVTHGATASPSATASTTEAGHEAGSEAPRTAEAAASDTTMTIPGGQAGAVFRSLTVEGEDRVHVEFDRPTLVLDLDPSQAPGLDWGSASDVLDRTVPDLGAPMLQSSAQLATPALAHPWLGHFITGAVARFRPEVKGVERWKLTIVDSKGQNVAAFEGTGEPPREISWDGRTTGGGLVTPGLTYSYVLEARDRAGNKRNFVGQGFKVSAYRIDSIDNPMMVFTGRELSAPDPSRPPSASDERGAAPILIEAAGWLNQSPKALQSVRVTATARTMDQATSLCALVTRQMAPYLLGDPARVQSLTDVQPDAPEGGAVRITAGK
jgi:hypothetical protein